MLTGKRLYPYVERVVGESTGVLRFFQGRPPKTPYPVRHSSGSDLASHCRLGAATPHRDESRLLRCEGSIVGKAGIPGREMVV
jgi:hypothetical protein